VTSRNIVLVVLILFAVASFYLGRRSGSGAAAKYRGAGVRRWSLRLAMAVRLSTEEQLRLVKLGAANYGARC